MSEIKGDILEVHSRANRSVADVVNDLTTGILLYSLIQLLSVVLL